MSINQTELFDNLEKRTQSNHHDDFIFQFLSLYGYLKRPLLALKKTTEGAVEVVTYFECYHINPKS